ncbi:hypothetical protein H2198_003601 [Neophaeococcomyces mojaviensis]|uniref:Uncharacterized protein n=1 Tax=Neophaeococcomyces mojaviensis TaxID=3383035 RepID=A0ACC3AAV6_9EURO|nr:hypothetical protein H2198_003601 [Knufia sp. JES_112]
MKFLTASFLLALTSAAILDSVTPSLDESPVTASAAPSGPSSTTRNVNHIFNAVRGAMRQWDSSWNHNGMSFFLATVPQGIQFYHGTRKEEAVTGLDWLAFEPEHALMFAMARPRRRPPPNESDPDASMTGWRKHERWKSPDQQRFPEQDSDDRQPSPFSRQRHEYDGPPSLQPHHGPDCELPGHPPSFGFPDHEHGPPPPGFPDHDHHGPGVYLPPPSAAPHQSKRGHKGPPPPPQPPFFAEKGHQRPIKSQQPSPPAPPNDGPLNGTGYLHFYRTHHPLNLLLVDGMSAGKTGRGTLDSQDYALLASHPVNRSLLAPFNDRYRAELLCNMTQTTWKGKIDGFIRMEGGFEIVMCDFERHLELVRVQPIPFADDGTPSKGPGHGFEGLSRFRIYQAIADRYHGIAGGRVLVDYANMVSAFNYDLDLFISNTALPDEMIPRLKNVSQAELQRISSDITSMVLGPALKSSVDWQAVAEMVVQHFAATLQQLASPQLPLEEFLNSLTALLWPAITDGINDLELNAQRCVEQFIPLSYYEALASRAVHNVTYHICHTLISTLKNISSSPSPDNHFTLSAISEMYAAAQTSVEELISYLSWPDFHFCSPGCAMDELCILPIWPLTSSVETRKQPTCKNATELAKEGGAAPGGPGRRGEKNYWYDGDEFRGGPKPRRPGQHKSDYEHGKKDRYVTEEVNSCGELLENVVMGISS